MAETPAVRQTIVQLLSHMRDGKEIREYLNRFSKVDQSRFAVVKVGGAVIRDDLEGLAAALAFLQSVGLLPIVVHGGGPQLDAALGEAGISLNGLDRLEDHVVVVVVHHRVDALFVAFIEVGQRKELLGVYGAFVYAAPVGSLFGVLLLPVRSGRVRARAELGKEARERVAEHVEH